MAVIGHKRRRIRSRQPRHALGTQDATPLRCRVGFNQAALQCCLAFAQQPSASKSLAPRRTVQRVRSRVPESWCLVFATFTRLSAMRQSCVTNFAPPCRIPPPVESPVPVLARAEAQPTDQTIGPDELPDVYVGFIILTRSGEEYLVPRRSAVAQSHRTIQAQTRGTRHDRHASTRYSGQRTY